MCQLHYKWSPNPGPLCWLWDEPVAWLGRVGQTRAWSCRMQPQAVHGAQFLGTLVLTRKTQEGMPSAQ